MTVQVSFKQARRQVWRRLLWGKYQLFQRRRFNRLVLEPLGDHSFLVLPGVMNPVLFRTGRFLGETLNGELVPPGCDVLDMGTGTGVGGITAATWAAQVVCVDINPEAVRCAKINALLNRVDGSVSVYQSDLFAAVTGQRFDVVLFNPPYYRGSARPGFDQAWRSLDVVERFAAALNDHLTVRGYALLVLSTDGDLETFLQVFKDQAYDISVVNQKDMGNEIITVYQMRPSPRDGGR